MNVSLVSKGFVKRFENENDTRAKTIILEIQGKEMAIKAVKIVEKIDKDFFEKLQKEEKSQLNQLFTKLI